MQNIPSVALLAASLLVTPCDSFNVQHRTYSTGITYDRPMFHTTEFWGSVRSKEEIIEYAAGAVFGSDRHGNSLNKECIDVISAEPPFFLIHDFLDDDMCEEIIQTAERCGLKRSRVGAHQKTEEKRTSEQVWLGENTHELEDPLPLRRFATKVSRLTGLPPNHQENLQVVRYEEGQRFDLHLDHLDEFNDLECRGRLATCLLYLNSSDYYNNFIDHNNDDDASFTGGETGFPEFGTNVVPKRGSAIFWWNTVERPGSEGYDCEMFLHGDVRMRHAGLPILSGEKWIANRWVHPIPVSLGVVGED
uniref:Fe2OG dioxygenase domain-containing protein n=1 Tax=Leptocylindrus danicus TaxID=163516 RepID=A0A7S2KZI0_9STRA|mmetsp:Transcript_28535/g.41981  ORF Transcript_28535/g.41981 Transcript_28535/m.41981 type:complete len:305 (+) Transcript_28535:46-960(+)